MSEAMTGPVGMLDVDRNQISVSKRDWNSMPAEIKRKVIKFLPLRSRFSVMLVCKSWHEISTQLNCQETKLVIVDQVDLELGKDTNSLCSHTSHTFDRNSVIDLFKELDADEAAQLASNFPNLIALRFQLDSKEVVNAFGYKCRKLEHLSLMFDVYTMNLINFELSNITCFDWRSLNGDQLALFPNLKYYSGGLCNPRLFANLLSKGLVGYSMMSFLFSENFLHRCLPEITKHLISTEVLYNLNLCHLKNAQFLSLLPQMSKLTTVFASCLSHDMNRILCIESLRKLTLEIEDTQVLSESRFRNDFQNQGHLLKSLRIGIQMHPEEAIRVILANCPNLEELNFHQYTPDNNEVDQHSYNQSLARRNTLREFKLLQQFTKLEKCEIEWHEVDVKFLRMLDTNIPELEELCASGGAISIEQMLAFQHLINKFKTTQV